MDKLRKESRFCARLAAALDEIRAISLPRRAVCGQAQIADGFLAAQLPVNHSSEIGPLASLAFCDNNDALLTWLSFPFRG